MEELNVTKPHCLKEKEKNLREKLERNIANIHSRIR